MPLNRKLLGAAAFSLALAGGGAAGAVLGTPNFSGAQDDSTSTEVDDSTTSRREGPFAHRGEGLSVAADALGISVEELRSALQAGSSIAQVAETQGVDLEVVIDALVEQARERLAELEAALPDRVTALVNREGWGDRHGPGPRGGGHRHRLAAPEDVPAEDGAS
jgi:hypothetical protein